MYVTTKNVLKIFGAICPVASLVTSSNLKNEDTAKSDCFCDFFACLKGRGANATLLL